MFEFFKKKELTSEEKLKSLFKSYFKEFVYPEWQTVDKGIYQLPDSGVVIIPPKTNKLKIEDINYLIEIISKKEHLITEEHEINLVDSIKKSIDRYKMEFETEGACTICQMKYELIFLCDKFLR